MKRYEALEFFSGLGGMHYALSNAVDDSNFFVRAAFEINPNAKKTYLHNFSNTHFVEKDITGLTAKKLDEYGANVWLMSPPCQPYSRRGNKGDLSDNRTSAFRVLFEELQKMKSPPTYILLENVEGFEESEGHQFLIKSVQRYSFKEFILSPHNFGIPNLRDRYFFIAKLCKNKKVEKYVKNILRYVPGDHSCTYVEPYVNGTCEPGTAASEKLWAEKCLHCRPLSTFLEKDLENEAELQLPEKILKKSGGAIDIVSTDSTKTDCFTKSYSKYAIGSGSVLLTSTDSIDHPIPRSLDHLKSLKLRYFSPREVARLHGLPESFSFPDDISLKQRYGLLGNSLSVTVVSSLLRFLFSTENFS
eukprot:g5109.t1